MKISIIITTYNRPNALGKVLEALRYQMRLTDEVIVADDGSGPETAKLVERLSKGFPCPVYHVWQEDRGFRAAAIRNKAIKKSHGEYIILLDGDCIPGKHFIKDHLFLSEKGFFLQGKRALVSEELSAIFTHEIANSFQKLLKPILSRNISNAHHIIRLRFFPAYSSTKQKGIKSCNMAFFKEDILAINGFNQNFIGWGREDSELAIRFYKYGLKRKEHPFMAVCFHLWHKENDRKQLSINDKLLQEAIDSHDYVCTNGLVQKN